MKPEDVAKLFKPFTQLDSSLSRRYEGTGLGLALVKKLVELHNGTVTVKSTIGQGSSFIVVLPWLQSLDYSQAPNVRLTENVLPPVLPEPEKTSSQLILLAEDNENNASVIMDLLDYHGYKVIQATHGGEVLPLAEEHHPDLIMMDIQMPVMDGLEVTRQIRSKPEHKDLPIIALTALAMDGDRERCLAAGANEYMSKPFNLNDLAGLIAKFLRRTE